MPGIQVVTDSACDLPPELADKLGYPGRPSHDPVR